MLIRFSCKNFRSIGETPLKLDMVSATKIQSHNTHICASSKKKVNVLRNAAIYGANSAGKTTFIQAIDFTLTTILQGAIPQEAINEFCRAGNGLEQEESTFDVQFKINGNTYDYGFSCIFSQLRVTSEWLYKLDKNPMLLFQRNNTEIELGISSLEKKYENEDKNRFEIYKKDFCDQTAELPNLLFFPIVGRGKRSEQGSTFNDFAQAFLWFERDLRILNPNPYSPTYSFYANGKRLEDIADVLASFDTGIYSLEKKPIDMAELDRYVAPEAMVNIKNILREELPVINKNSYRITTRSGSSFIEIEGKGSEDPKATILEIYHKDSTSIFQLGDESDGTQRLFGLMDILFAESNSTTFIVDELSRSLHPMLTQQLVTLFNKVRADDDCQLIFTTHENDIMSYKYFRRDEIWFIDKNDSGCSNLYSLDDFDRIRSDARIGKQYLEGRYGGIPVLSLEKALIALKIDEAKV